MAVVIDSIEPEKQYKDFDNFHDEERYVYEWIAEQKAFYKSIGNLDISGETLRFAVADGYAQYIIVGQDHTGQLTLIHLGHWDAYHAHPYLIKGMDVDDARNELESAKRLAALFAARR